MTGGALGHCAQCGSVGLCVYVCVLIQKGQFRAVSGYLTSLVFSWCTEWLFYKNASSILVFF